MIRLVIYRSRFARVVRRNQQWRWRLVHANGKIIATSGGDGYSDKDECTRMGVGVCSGKYKPDQIID